MSFIVEASLAAAWMLPDEHSDAAHRLMLALKAAPGLVPTLFWPEMRNLFVMAERRERIARGEAVPMMLRLRGLPLADLGMGSDSPVLGLAVKHNLTAYEACYLFFALDRTVPLATLDRGLAEAARSEHIELLGPLAP